jgi:hypothetical protein
LGLPIEGYRANDAILNAVQFFPKTGGVAGRLTHTEVRERHSTLHLYVSLFERGFLHLAGACNDDYDYDDNVMMMIVAG